MSGLRVTEDISKFTITECEFTDVLPFWRDRLWPGRKSPIEPYSALGRDGSINIHYAKNQVWFLKAVCAEFTQEAVVTRNFNQGPVVTRNSSDMGLCLPSQATIVGVTSGHFTEPREFRIRGTYVMPQYQDHGVGRQLIEKIIEIAVTNQAKLVWTLPRQNSFSFYKKCGFEQATDWSNDYEFGPNCVAQKNF